ncbi:hypothetical protein BC941DRAFT_468922 [Chlamydoabsidia padenii]|nr:hypothetical protein BC941DRAFT_468922 [Chlamydoabsidia padenii]
MHREQHSVSANVRKWLLLLSDPPTCCKQTTKKCNDIINEVNSSEEDTDLTAGSILFRLPLNINIPNKNTATATAAEATTSIGGYSS